MSLLRTTLPATALFALACSSSGGDVTKTDAEYKADVVTGMHDALLDDVNTLHEASVELQAAAPSPKGRGWDADLDADALTAMNTAWLKARGAYERTEGALAPLFPKTDEYIDARYDDFLAELGDAGDQDLFDDQGVTGMHAIERILFVKTTPASVIMVESTLPGYKAAAWPATEDEATEFKTKLAMRLVNDTEDLREQWKPQIIDLSGAYFGLIDLMNEQREKVSKAASDEEESRYAQRTMADIRDNLTGTEKVYALFQPWLATKTGGPAIDKSVSKGFDGLSATYDTVKGDAIPQPPTSWSSETPSADDLATPFGMLFTAVQDAVDPNKKGSIVDGMSQTAKTVGLPLEAM